MVGAVAVGAAAFGLAIAFGAWPDRSPTPEAYRSPSGPSRQTTPSAALEPPPVRWSAWPLDRAMATVDRARVVAAGRSLRVEAATTLCSGVGKPVGRAQRRWYSFDCTYTLFRNGVDQDLEFRLTPLDSKRFVIDGVRWIPDQR